MNTSLSRTRNRPWGLLEPDAWKAGSSGSEGAGAQQCAPATRGFHHRLVRTRPRRGTGGLVYLARWPSRKAAQHARDRIRLLTMRARLAAPVEQIVQEVNAFLRGWVGFFRYGNSAREFDKISKYAVMRVALFVAKRHQRGRSWGFAQVYRSPDSLGLISLNGTVIAPRPNRPWRAPVEHRR